MVLRNNDAKDGESDGKDRRNRVRLAGWGHGGPGRRGLQVQGLELRLRSRRGRQPVQAGRDLRERGAAAGAEDLRGLRRGVAGEGRRVRDKFNTMPKYVVS